MKVSFPKNNETKTISVPNWVLFNRVGFGIIKLFLISKHPLFFKIKYKHIKPVIKIAKQYKDYEIVSVQSHSGDFVKVFI